MPTSARYWRIRIDGFSGYPGIAELEFAAIGAAKYTGTPMSSSDYGGQPASYAFDGNVNTFWGPATSSGTQWIGLDCGSAVQVDTVRIQGRYSGQYITDYTVQSSPDNVTWSDEWAVTGITHVDWLQSFPRAGLGTVLWRFTPSATDGGGVWGFSEMELRASAGGADETAPGIVVMGRSYDGTVALANAFDNNTGTNAAGPNTTQPMTVEFATAKAIIEIAIRSRTDSSQNQAPTAFVLDSSEDGKTWTAVKMVSGSTGWALNEQRVFTVAPPKARLTAAHLEVLGYGAPKARLTAAHLEVLGYGAPKARLTDAFLEVLAPVTPDNTTPVVAGSNTVAFATTYSPSGPGIGVRSTFAGTSPTAYVEQAVDTASALSIPLEFKLGTGFSLPANGDKITVLELLQADDTSVLRVKARKNTATVNGYDVVVEYGATTVVAGDFGLNSVQSVDVTHRHGVTDGGLTVALNNVTIHNEEHLSNAAEVIAKVRSGATNPAGGDAPPGGGYIDHDRPPVTPPPSGEPGTFVSELQVSPGRVKAVATPVTITVISKDFNGDPVSGNGVSLSADLAGAFADVSGTTDLNGEFSTTYTPGEVGTHTISADITSAYPTITETGTLVVAPPSGRRTGRRPASKLMRGLLGF